MAYDVRLPGTLSKVSEEYPEVELDADPLGDFWLLRCSGRPERVQAVAAKLSPLSLLRYPATDGGAVSFIVPVPAGVRRFFTRASEGGGILLPPIRWRDGWLRARLLTLEGRTPADLTTRFPSVRVALKRRVRLDHLAEELETPGRIVPHLTPRQAQLIRAAIREGYYEVPRRTTVGKIARTVGIARSTAEEHLRAAESSLVRALAPLVRVAGTDGEGPGDDGEALRFYARFSGALGVYVQMAMHGDRIAGVSLTARRPRGTTSPPHPYLARILRHVATGREELNDLPVELRVSPFEQIVLEQIRRIPTGETRTYRELARTLGRPGAARAVGNACAHNPVPIVVPCHRVVPSAGGVGRYSGGGGARTKTALLEREGAMRE